MMSGNSANPIFFNNNKKKIERPEHLLTQPPTSDNILFFALPVPPAPPPSKWTSYIYHPLGVVHLWRFQINDQFCDPLPHSFAKITNRSMVQKQ